MLTPKTQQLVDEAIQTATAFGITALVTSKDEAVYKERRAAAGKAYHDLTRHLKELEDK